MNKNTIDVMFSKKSDNWETPQEFYDGLDKYYGFTLDPCATKENTKNIKYYTEQDNGLEKSWQGEIAFVNPPYSAIGEWVAKSYFEYRLGNATVVLLIPARIDTKYFHRYCMCATGLGFVQGRLKFGNRSLPSWKDDGSHKISSAPFPSIVVEFDPKIEVSKPILFSVDRNGIITP